MYDIASISWRSRDNCDRRRVNASMEASATHIMVDDRKQIFQYDFGKCE